MKCDVRAQMELFEQTLLSNSGEDAFESAIKLLSAKLLDEKRQKDGHEIKFHLYSTPIDTHNAVSQLYREAIVAWPDIGTGEDNLNISPHHLERTMRTLVGWSMIGSDLSILDAALERLVSRDQKGSMGQYFTPRDLIRLCIRVLNPRGNEKIIDPACGSGGFLFEASSYSMSVDEKHPLCLGIDFSPRSVKVATLLSNAHDETNIHISKANSIDGHEYVAQAPKKWELFHDEGVGSSMKEAKSWGAWNKIGADIIVTNPPFAGDVDDKRILSAYESQQNPGNKKTTREILFLERCLNMLKPGGRMAIILPQGVLSNDNAAFIRQWVLNKSKLIGVIGVHPYAFLPYTGVKTSIVFLEKKVAESNSPYNVFFATSIQSGKDSRGRAVNQSDYEEIGNIFRTFLFDQGYSWAPIPEVKCKRAHSSIAINEVVNAGRIDAEYFDQEIINITKSAEAISTCMIRDIVAPKIQRFKKSNVDQIAYFDIGSVDKRTGILVPNLLTMEEIPSRAAYLVQIGDILVSTVRPENNVVAMVTQEEDFPMVASSGFCVLRPIDCSSEELFAFCKTSFFKRLLSRKATSSMYPTVADRDVLDLPFIRLDEEESIEVSRGMNEGLRAIQLATQEMQKSVALMDCRIMRRVGDSSALIP